MDDRILEILERSDDPVTDLRELVTEYQAKAWDKGFDKGASISHWWERNPGASNKENKNPYRAQLEHHNGRKA